MLWWIFRWISRFQKQRSCNNGSINSLRYFVHFNAISCLDYNQSRVANLHSIHRYYLQKLALIRRCLQSARSFSCVNFNHFTRWPNVSLGLSRFVSSCIRHSIKFCYVTESPKFVLGQGKATEAYEILKKMNRLNNGKDSEFEQFEIREEVESIENRQRIVENAQSRFPLIASIWSQTVPLFKPPYLFSTILICSIQMPIFMTGTGFFMFFAVVLNKMATNIHDTVNQRIAMCDVINMYSSTSLNGQIDEVSYFYYLNAQNVYFN